MARSRSTCERMLSSTTRVWVRLIRRTSGPSPSPPRAVRSAAWVGVRYPMMVHGLAFPFPNPGRAVTPVVRLFPPVIALRACREKGAGNECKCRRVKKSPPARQRGGDHWENFACLVQKNMVPHTGYQQLKGNPHHCPISAATTLGDDHHHRRRNRDSVSCASVARNHHDRLALHGLRKAIRA